MPSGSKGRSQEAQAWRHLYDTAAWKRARKAQLSHQPLCERCLAAGFVVPAKVVNHRTPHKGDRALFLDSNNHASSCAPCHDMVDGPEERGQGKGRATGFSGDIGQDGWPTDPRHPVNAKRSS